MDVNLLMDEIEEAFDLSAAATAQMIARTSPSSLPLISCYCPSALRLIQARFPELLSRVLPICSPLELAADLWKMRTNSPVPVTLLAPCSAKISMVREPQGRERSPARLRSDGAPRPRAASWRATYPPRTSIRAKSAATAGYSGRAAAENRSMCRRSLKKGSTS